MADENTDPAQAKRIEELKSAARFLLWCKENNKNTDLAEEWILALIEKLWPTLPASVPTPLPTLPTGNTGSASDQTPRGIRG